MFDLRPVNRYWAIGIVLMALSPQNTEAAAISTTESP